MNVAFANRRLWIGVLVGFLVVTVAVYWSWARKAGEPGRPHSLRGDGSPEAARVRFEAALANLPDVQRKEAQERMAADRIRTGYPNLRLGEEWISSSSIRRKPAVDHYDPGSAVPRRLYSHRIRGGLHWKLRQRAEATACVSNLRQIGACGLLYSADNDQKLPRIEPWPSDPVCSSEDEVKSLLEGLGPYGLTERTVICRTDLSGPDYFAKEGTSFQWCPIANGQSLVSGKLSWSNLGEDVKPDRLLVAFAYTNIHFEKSNVLFGDGHMAAASGN